MSSVLLKSLDKVSRKLRCVSTVPPVVRSYQVRRGSFSSREERVMKLPASIPSTSRFFSGSRFPLATDSSMEFHMSFFFSPSFESAEAVVYVENLFVLAAMMGVGCNPGPRGPI